MPAVIYTLCALTSITCFVLLWRSWRGSGARLLFWSALCFGALSVNNVLLVVDNLVLPDRDLGVPRLVAALVAVLLLLFGLVWEEE
ncbi:MAG TPA: DUF5985 family protein [Ramlibacter sp.]|nr:DUF5985 family protein [Ramlibacter sp.]